MPSDLYATDGPKRLGRPISTIQPALYRESDAAAYCAVATQTLANHRSQDRFRLARLFKQLGRNDPDLLRQVTSGAVYPEVAAERSQFDQCPIFHGPRWINLGRAVRYTRDDLDSWIAGAKVAPWEGAA